MLWPPKRIMVGTDFSDTARNALSVAAAIARRTGASLDVVHSVHDPARMITGYEVLDSLLVNAENPEKLRAHALEHLRVQAQGVEGVVPELHLVQGDAAGELVALRELLDADLLVLGAQGLRGLRRFLLGSVADRVLRRPGCPLLLVKDKPAGAEFKRILIALELPDLITQWLETSVRLAHDLRGELVVLHVLPPRGYLSDKRHVEMHPESVRERIDRLVARLDPTCPVEVVVKQGDPTHVIPATAQELGIELIVLGAERNPDGWPGHVVDRVVRAGLPAALVIWPELESGEEFGAG